MKVDEVARQRWFEAIWADREERIYPELFGPCDKGIHTLTARHFEELGAREVDPRWLTHGVIVSPPNARRASALYVTSGLSNPWGRLPGSLDIASGLGFELVLQTRERAPWAVSLLQWLCAVQILTAASLMRGELLEPGDRIPLGKGVDGSGSSVRNLVLAEPTGFPSTFRLASGRVALFLAVGTTDEEHAFGGKKGSEALIERLKSGGIFPLTAPNRDLAP